MRVLRRWDREATSESGSRDLGSYGTNQVTLLLATRGRLGWAKILCEIIHNDVHFIVVEIGPFREHQIDHSRPLFLRRSFRRDHFQRMTRNTGALNDGLALTRRE